VIISIPVEVFRALIQCFEAKDFEIGHDIIFSNRYTLTIHHIRRYIPCF
jgi:hypothetical protein